MMTLIGSHNYDIRSQRWLGDHEICFPKKMFRSFLGRWSLLKDLWGLSLSNFTIMLNYNWRVFGSKLREPDRRFVECMDNTYIKPHNNLVISATVRL